MEIISCSLLGILAIIMEVFTTYWTVDQWTEAIFGEFTNNIMNIVKQLKISLGKPVIQQAGDNIIRYGFRLTEYVGFLIYFKDGMFLLQEKPGYSTIARVALIKLTFPFSKRGNIHFPDKKDTYAYFDFDIMNNRCKVSKFYNSPIRGIQPYRSEKDFISNHIAEILRISLSERD